MTVTKLKHGAKPVSEHFTFFVVRISIVLSWMETKKGNQKELKIFVLEKCKYSIIRVISY